MVEWDELWDTIMPTIQQNVILDQNLQFFLSFAK